MRSWHLAIFLSLSLAFPTAMAAQGTSQEAGNTPQPAGVRLLPTGSIIVKGAWASASDSVTPLPEGGSFANNTFSNKYFALTYALAPGWTQPYNGPPPSDSGSYVLAQLKSGEANKAGRATILITAQDLFFTAAPAANALELMNYTASRLQPDYQVERPLTPVRIADHSFVRLDYFSPAAELHWYVLATQIRCHVIQFVFTAGDTKLLESLIQQMNDMKLPAEAGPILGTGGGDVPLCIKDYARSENVIERVDPVFTERRFNAVPVRITIDKEGKVKHIHFLSAFPDQAKDITDALLQWRFKPYLLEGRPVEVETGIVFGRLLHPPAMADDALAN